MHTTRIFLWVIYLIYQVLSLGTDEEFDVETTDTSITLSWSDDSSLGSTILEWEIILDGDIRETLPGSRLNRDGRVELTTGLTAGESYVLQIIFKTGGSYLMMEETVLDTVVRLNPKPVKNLQRIEPGEPSKGDFVGSVLLTWEVDDQDTFKVLYKSTFIQPNEWSEYFQSTNTQMTLTGLVPGDRYQFKVYAVSDGQFSQSKIIEESIRPGYVSNLWIKETGSTFVTLYAGAPTGVVRSWFLEYIPSFLNEGWHRLFDFEMNKDKNNSYYATIYNLIPGLTYRIKIAAEGAHGTDSLDPNRGATTEIACTTKPIANCSIDLAEPATDTSVKLRYTPTEGYFDYYLFELAENGRACPNDDCPHKKTKQKKDDNHVVIFNDLKPGTRYEALLRIVAGDQTSGSVVLNFETSGSSAESNNLLSAVIVLAILVFVSAVIIWYFLMARNRNNSPKNVCEAQKNQEMRIYNDVTAKAVNLPIPNARSVQPVPPLPRIPPERSVCVFHEYLEILPNTHEHCTDTRYLEPTGTMVRDSGEYDKPYEKLQRARGTEENLSQNRGEINPVCE